MEDLNPSAEVRLDADQLLVGEFQLIGSSEGITYKPRWGAASSTDLDASLSGQNVDTVIVCGCNFPNCPRTTVYVASEREYRIVLVPDATFGTYRKGQDELGDIGVAVKDAESASEWVIEGARLPD